MWQNGRYVRQQFPTRALAAARRDVIEREIGSSQQLVAADPDVAAAAARAASKGYTLLQACEAFERAMAELERVSVADAVKEFIVSKTAKGLRPRSLENLKARTYLIVERLGDQQTLCVTAHMLESCMPKGWSARSRINFLTVASGFMGWCVRRRYAARNVAEDIERPLPPDRQPIILTQQEAKDLLDRTRLKESDLVAYVALSLFAGLRNAEVRRIGWSDIRDGVVHVDAIKAKTRARRLVTVQPNLSEWLKLGGILPVPCIQKRWAKIRPERWEPDCMRRTFVSYHLAAFGSAAATALEAGHTESVLFRHYRGIVKSTDAEIYWKIVPT